MQLILMRHGPAQDPGGRTSDHERELTPEGARLVQAAAQGLARLLPKGQPHHIWTSPLIRARQTADIVAEAIAPASVALHAEIAAGDLDRLGRTWQEIPTPDTLILVGHEPHLKIWGARLSGVMLPIDTAAAAGFAMESGWPAAGRLLWFLQAEALARLGSV